MATAPSLSGFSDIQVIVTQKKIWLITDEAPVKHLLVELVNEQGKIVLKREYSSKVVDWSLDVRDLPSGDYRLFLDTRLAKTFQHKGPRA
jgi:hypothetical protein